MDRISFQEDSIAVENAIFKLSEQTNVSIHYNSFLFNREKIISIDEHLREIIRAIQTQGGQIFLNEKNNIENALNIKVDFYIENNITLENALFKLGDNANVSIYYNSGILNRNKLIDKSIHVENKSVRSILNDYLLPDSVIISGSTANQIFLVKKKKEDIVSQNAITEPLNIKTGYAESEGLVFVNADLHQAIKEIGKAYGKMLKVNDNDLYGCGFNADLRELNFEEVLSFLINAYEIQVVEKGNVYYVYGGACK